MSRQNPELAKVKADSGFFLIIMCLYKEFYLKLVTFLAFLYMFFISIIFVN